MGKNNNKFTLYNCIKMLLVIAILVSNSGCVGELLTTKLHSERTSYELRGRAEFATDSVATQESKKGININIQYSVEKEELSKNFKEAYKNSHLTISCVSDSYTTEKGIQKDNEEIKQKIISDQFSHLIIYKTTNSKDSSSILNAALAKQLPSYKSSHDVGYLYSKDSPRLCNNFGNTLGAMEFSNQDKPGYEPLQSQNLNNLILQHRHVTYSHEHPLFLRIIGTPVTVVIDVATFTVLLPFIIFL